jgi:hypothetical protein
VCVCLCVCVSVCDYYVHVCLCMCVCLCVCVTIVYMCVCASMRPSVCGAYLVSIGAGCEVTWWCVFFFVFFFRSRYTSRLSYPSACFWYRSGPRRGNGKEEETESSGADLQRRWSAGGGSECNSTQEQDSNFAYAWLVNCFVASLMWLRCV